MLYVKNIILEFNHLSKISLEDLVSFFYNKGYASFNVSGVALKVDEAIPENNIWFSKVIV